MNLLIEKGILRKRRGKIIDLTIVGKNHNKERKQRYITDPAFEALQRLRQEMLKEQKEKDMDKK